MKRLFDYSGREVLEDPVLIWEAGDPQAGVAQGATAAGGPREPPLGENPLVLLLHVSSTASEAGLSVGRSETNDLVIDDQSVSRVHAFIHCDARTARWKISDAGSRNGTWVEAVRVGKEETWPLNDGCQVKLGDMRLRFMLAESFPAYFKRRVASR